MGKIYHVSKSFLSKLLSCGCGRTGLSCRYVYRQLGHPNQRRGIEAQLLVSICSDYSLL